MHTHRYAEILPTIRQSIASLPGLVVLRAVLVNFLAHAGETEESAQLLGQMAPEDFRFPRDLMWLTSNALSAEAAAMVGDREWTALFYDRLLPFAGQVVTSRVSCIGPVAHSLGTAAWALDRTEAAAEHFRTAIDLSTGLRSPLHRARGMVGLARCVRSADPAETARLLDEVTDLADRFGLPGQAARARELTG